MEKRTLLIISLIILLILIGSIVIFFPYNPTKPPKADDNGWTEQGINKLVEANNRFAFDLYSKLNEKQDNNIFYSPYSIFSALAIVYEGAKGETAYEMQHSLYLPSKSILEPNFARIYNIINNKSNDYELRTGNALWIQKNYPVLKSYKDRVERYYGAKAANLDFINNPEQSRSTINGFIEEQTNHKIEDLIPAGGINPLTRMVITNAIYFKGVWRWQFDESNTKEMDFHVNNSVIKVPMMHLKNKDGKMHFNYAETDKLQILELPYKGELSMIIILPKQREYYDYMTNKTIKLNYTLKDINLTYDNFKAWKKAMRETDELEDIYIPKFELHEKYTLNNALKNLGIRNAFSYNADFSGIDGKKDLYIDKVFHKAYIKVNEEGTEAAAATAINIAITAVNPNKPIFKADHPFILIIQDKRTGTILFLGKVVNPNEND